jgi:hypothetical protein
MRETPAGMASSRCVEEDEFLYSMIPTVEAPRTSVILLSRVLPCRRARVTDTTLYMTFTSSLCLASLLLFPRL